jgi:hypothetical protein
MRMMIGRRADEPDVSADELREARVNAARRCSAWNEIGEPVARPGGFYVDVEPTRSSPVLAASSSSRVARAFSPSARRCSSISGGQGPCSSSVGRARKPGRSTSRGASSGASGSSDDQARANQGCAERDRQLAAQ